jgi:hypothetical protein
MSLNRDQNKGSSLVVCILMWVSESADFPSSYMGVYLDGEEHLEEQYE